MNHEYSNAYMKIGILYMNLEWGEKSVAAFRRALSYDPDSVQALYLLGRAYEKLGHLEDSLATYDEALMHEPNHREARARRIALQPKATTYYSKSLPVAA